MNENTGRHDTTLLATASPRRAGQKISDTAPRSTASSAPRQERTAEQRAADTWLQTVSMSASLLPESEGGPSASDLESAILELAARATEASDLAALHAQNAPTLPAAALAAPTPFFETTAQVPEAEPVTAVTLPASELDEIVLDAMLGGAAPDAKLDPSDDEAVREFDSETTGVFDTDDFDARTTGRFAAASPSVPRVTIVMPAYNEEKFIETCIASVQAQDYAGDIEILVADGRSTDRTREILARLAKEDPRIRMIDNPARLQAAGLGLAVKEARGEIIVRMDVHAEYAPDYVSACVRTLEKTGAQNVGGAQRARAKSLFQKALCVALGSKLGTGGAGYRHEDAEGFVDTVFLGAFRRKVFETVGLWDPKAITNEDSELNQRILESGGTIYLSKDIVVHYYPRDSLKALATQYFRYGRGRARTLLKLGKVPTLRPFLPFLAMTGLASTVVLPPLWPLAPIAFGAYALATGAEAIRIGRGLGAKGVATVWSIFPTLHASHAAGVWAGLVRYLREKDWTDEPELVSAQTEMAL